MTTILSSTVRHKVSFRLNPESKAVQPTPLFVDTRLIRDILDYPKDVDYVTFHDVVENIVQLPDGKTRAVHSEQVNPEIFFVFWDQVTRQNTYSEGTGNEVEVHPSLKGKVWVYASQKKQLEEQKAA